MITYTETELKTWFLKEVAKNPDPDDFCYYQKED